MPDPSCPSDGVLVQVAATGVCRSDWHAWRGHDPVQLPIIPGHEFAGVIAAVGADVSGWQVGDRVTTPFVLGCGRCEFCRAGDAQVCPNQEQPGFTLPGSFAQLVAVPRAAANLVRLPDDVSFVAAASLGCRFATAFRALVNHGAVKAGQWVAVHGCGGVGLSAVMIAKAFGAKVVAVDVTADALAAAQRLGATRSSTAPRSTTSQQKSFSARVAVRTSVSTPLATPSRPRHPWPRCAAVVATCRWGCCSVPTRIRRFRWTA